MNTFKPQLFFISAIFIALLVILQSCSISNRKGYSQPYAMHTMQVMAKPDSQQIFSKAEISRDKEVQRHPEGGRLCQKPLPVNRIKVGISESLASSLPLPIFILSPPQAAADSIKAHPETRLKRLDVIRYVPLFVIAVAFLGFVAYAAMFELILLLLPFFMIYNLDIRPHFAKQGLLLLTFTLLLIAIASVFSSGYLGFITIGFFLAGFFILMLDKQGKPSAVAFLKFIISAIAVSLIIVFIVEEMASGVFITLALYLLLMWVLRHRNSRTDPGSDTNAIKSMVFLSLVLAFIAAIFMLIYFMILAAEVLSAAIVLAIPAGLLLMCALYLNWLHKFKTGSDT